MAWSGYDINDSCDSLSQEEASGTSDGEEVPIWVRGEQRWVSGVTHETTCSDLVIVLLQDQAEGVYSGLSRPIHPQEYVITERWRRVEQPLDPRTKILKIWNAWGEAQAEVRFSLRRTSEHENGGDSGRESPTGSTNSALGKRRHRHNKSIYSTSFSVNTIHPKRLLNMEGRRDSHRKGIEQLMKLILAQGETIQHQLQKLRDRETQISNIEEETHRSRVKEHGSNYLLEAYLSGLPGECDHIRDQEKTHSDSGVVTEGGSDQATSPEASSSPVNGNPKSTKNDDSMKTKSKERSINNTDELYNEPYEDLNNAISSTPKKKTRSKRETELMKEHLLTKNYTETLSREKDECKDDASDTESHISNLRAQIDVFEKLVVLNKHLQREEELLVRLGAKCRRYETKAKEGQSEEELREALDEIKQTTEKSTTEMERNSMQLEEADKLLRSRADTLNRLHVELEQAEHEHEQLHYDMVNYHAAQQNYQLKYIVLNEPKNVDNVSTGQQISNALAKGQYSNINHFANVNTVSPAGKIGPKKMLRSVNDVVDSNSDTGLSSLSEEGASALNTLV